MRGLVIKVGATAAALWVAVGIVGGLDFEGNVWGFLGVSLLIVLANMVVKPILNIFSLPLVVLTLGLFLLITNALTLQFVIWLSSSERMDLGLTSTGFFWATLLGAIVISVVRIIIDSIVD
ncbi:MAG TPA: phage holin family protein [Acidimicrobiia bacterium]